MELTSWSIETILAQLRPGISLGVQRIDPDNLDVVVLVVVHDVVVAPRHDFGGWISGSLLMLGF